MDLIKIKKALISVSDKKNLDKILKTLQEYNVEILSTGGTFKYIRDLGYQCTEVSDYTKSQEILDGRVKTLHPKIHAGLLAKADNKEHINQISKQNIDFINLLIVNLYPFEKKLLENANEEVLVENIDIGGPSMLRSAAKNYKFTTVISDPEQYDECINELNKTLGSTSLNFRKKMSTNAFLETAYYDSIISNWMNKEQSKFPKKITISGSIQSELRYGENPHQQASIYNINYKKDLLNDIKQLQGKELSYNNYLDMYAAVSISKCLDNAKKTCVIVKHNNPCGCAASDNLSNAYKLALNADTISAFGGVVCFNDEIDKKLAEKLSNSFYEIIISNKFTNDALDIFKKKKNLRLIKIKNHLEEKLIYNIIGEKILIQDKDIKELRNEDLKIVTKIKPTKKQIEDLKFAFNICRFVKSNAIVIVKNKQSLGIGAGQTNRLASSKIACQNAKLFFKKKVKNSVAASDAFFPFADGLKELIKLGVKSIIQPGGSIKDNEVIKAADKAKISMIFTSIRNFKH